MSHVSAVETVIEDLDALDQACKALGTVELVRGQKTYRWFGSWANDYHGENAAYKNGIAPEDYGKCEHAIRVKGNDQAYEVGLVKNPKGRGYLLIYDFWQGGYGLEEAIGKGTDAGLLRREYALAVGMRKMARKGYRVERRINPATNKPQMRAWR